MHFPTGLERMAAVPRPVAAAQQPAATPPTPSLSPDPEQAPKGQAVMGEDTQASASPQPDLSDLLGQSNMSSSVKGTTGPLKYPGRGDGGEGGEGSGYAAKPVPGSGSSGTAAPGRRLQAQGSRSGGRGDHDVGAGARLTPGNAFLLTYGGADFKLMSLVLGPELLSEWLVPVEAWQPQSYQMCAVRPGG